MLSGHIHYAVHGGTYVIKFSGDVRVPHCFSLESLLDRMFSDANLVAVLVDLSETVSIDSTALGLIAKVAVSLKEHSQKKPVILSTNPDVNRILQSMGFERVFVILEKAPETCEEWQELPFDEPSQAEMTRYVIDAHRTLMAMNAKNKATFHDLVAALEKERNCQEK